MKSILENIVNNPTFSAWLFRFEQATIYTLYKTSNNNRWIAWMLGEKTINHRAICIQVKISGLHKNLPHPRLLIYSGNRIRSIKEGNYSEERKEFYSLQPFQAFPPKCNIQLVYGKGRRYVDLFFYLNEPRNL